MRYVLDLDPDLPETASPAELLQFAVRSVENNPDLKWDILTDTGDVVAENVVLPDTSRTGSSDGPARPRTTCGCGYELVWVNGVWEHDAAPYLWGDDHAPDPDDEPEPEARAFWDREDGING